MKFQITKLKCQKCGHSWVARKSRVVECPNCKTILERNKPILLEGKLLEGKAISPEGEVITPVEVVSG